MMMLLLIVLHIPLLPLTHLFRRRFVVNLLQLPLVLLEHSQRKHPLSQFQMLQLGLYLLACMCARPHALQRRKLKFLTHERSPA